MEIEYAFVKEVPPGELEALYRAAGWWTDEPGQREALPALVAGSFVFLVAREGGSLVGMARVLSDGVSDGYIQDVVVTPSHRSRGIGEALIRRLVERCREAGLGWVALVAEPGTRPFYEKLGFDLLGTGYEPMILGKR